MRPRQRRRRFGRSRPGKTDREKEMKTVGVHQIFVLHSEFCEIIMSKATPMRTFASQAYYQILIHFEYLPHSPTSPSRCSILISQSSSSSLSTTRRRSSAVCAVPIKYRVTHLVVPKLSIQGLFNSHNSPEPRAWEQPDVSPCRMILDNL